jgi:hypothetical protein
MVKPTKLAPLSPTTNLKSTKKPNRIATNLPTSTVNMPVSNVENSKSSAHLQLFLADDSPKLNVPEVPEERNATLNSSKP